MPHFQLFNVQTKAYHQVPRMVLCRVKWEHVPCPSGDTYTFATNSKEEALSLADTLTASTGAKHLLHDVNWHRRERERMQNGTYKLPVWHRRPFWAQRSPELLRHFTHVSVKNAELVAYTADETKGMIDVQTAIKPGAYLQKFFSDVLSAEEIKSLANLHVMYARGEAKEELVPVNFAETSADIVAVYRDGPESCMSGECAVYCKVYGAGDLAIAYTGEKDGARARALCWPERKIYGRVYPAPEGGFGASVEEAQDGKDLVQALEALGYRNAARGEFNGARLLKLTNRRGNWIMPYLDRSYGVNDEGKFWHMAEFGEYSCQSTCGTVEESEDEDMYCCDRCGEYENEEETAHVYVSRRHSETWCNRCVSNHATFCNDPGEYVCDNVVTTVDDESVPEWVAEDANYCERSSEYTNDEVAEVIVSITGAIAHWRVSYLRDETFTCTETGEVYALELASEGTLVSIKRDDGETHKEWRGVFKGVDIGQADYHSGDLDQKRLDFYRVAA